MSSAIRRSLASSVISVGLLCGSAVTSYSQEAVLNATMIENMYFTGRQAMDRRDWVGAHRSLSIYWWITQYIYSQSSNAEAVQFVNALNDNLTHIEWQMNDAIQSRAMLDNQLAQCHEALSRATGQGSRVQGVKSSPPAKPPLPPRPPMR